MAMMAHLGESAAPRIMTSGLSRVAASHSFRCDARQAEERFRIFDQWIAGVPSFTLGEVLPLPIVKGFQPTYVDASDSGIKVISTLAIQNMTIDSASCRIAQSVDYGASNVRKPRVNDVLLTVDGGTSIGKPVLFDLEGEYAVDSHIAMLRPENLDPDLLVYFLASPLGQLQFQRAESGASGQTAVTEDDIRRFKFPVVSASVERNAIAEVTSAREEARRLREEARKRELKGWEAFLRDCSPGL